MIALLESIRRAFPAEAYAGKITNHDHELEDPNLDEERDLYSALKGRQWTEISKQILQSIPDGYVLLSPGAFPFFLPAWLQCALDDIDGENEVRNFVVYAFSPRHDMVPDTTDHIVGRLRLLNSEQRLTLRSLLAEFAERGTTPFVKGLAGKAIALIDEVA